MQRRLGFINNGGGSPAIHLLLLSSPERLPGGQKKNQNAVVEGEPASVSISCPSVVKWFGCEPVHEL